MGKHLKRAVDAFYGALDDLYLSDLTDCNGGLERLLQLLDGPNLPHAMPARSRTGLPPPQSRWPHREAA